MKVMFVGCNPVGAGDLLVDSEVTQLARLLRGGKGEPVDFLPFPRLPIEELPLVIAAEQPEILHIAAHADSDLLMFANSKGELVPLSGDDLAVYLRIPVPPRLVYLNACKSDEIAQELKKVVHFAIGTTSKITNLTARASALLFYDRILGGATVYDAYDAGRVTMSAMQSDALTSRLYWMDGVDPNQIRLYRAPALVARFVDADYRPNKKGEYDIEIGVAGCPSNTSQVIFFTDETAEVEPEEACDVVRGTPVNNMFWNDEFDDSVSGDYRAYAAGTTTGGSAFTVAATVCNALEAYFMLRGTGPADIPEGARRAIEFLRSRNGANLPGFEIQRKEAKGVKKKRGDKGRK